MSSREAIVLALLGSLSALILFISPWFFLGWQASLVIDAAVVLVFVAWRMNTT